MKDTVEEKGGYSRRVLHQLCFMASKDNNAIYPWGIS